MSYSNNNYLFPAEILDSKADFYWFRETALHLQNVRYHHKTPI